MSRRAFVAIVRARVYAQRRTMFYACAAALIAGVVAPAGLPALVLLCALLGFAMALAQSPGVAPHLDLCEAGAPLFGREVARAKAVVPCLAATLAALAYVTGELLAGVHDAALALPVALAAVLAGTLVALSATVRRGPSRLLYVLLGATASAGAYALAVRSVAGEAVLCAVVAYVALRQYGEALARYDPI